MRLRSSYLPPASSRVKSESVTSWLEGIETHDEAVPQPLPSNRNRKRKRKLLHQDAHQDTGGCDRKTSKRRRRSTRNPGEVRHPLVEISENIIMPPRSPDIRKTPHVRALRPDRRMPPTQEEGQQEEQEEEEEEEEEEDNDTDPTPRGLKLTAATRSHPPDQDYEYVPGGYDLDEASSRSAGGSSRGSSMSKRSSSPVKVMEDLRYAETPTEYQILDGAVASRCQGFLKHYRELQDLSDRRGLIPRSLKPFIDSKLHELDRPSLHAYTPPPKNPKKKPNQEETDYENRMGLEAWEIYHQAQVCEKNGLPESSWNMKVYAPLLELVLRNPRFHNGLQAVDLTSAHISPRNLAASHTSRIPMQTKMVDFGICIVPSPDLDNHIRCHLRPLPAGQQSINQTMMSSVRRNPLALSLEAKVPFTGGQTSDVQLSIWAGAGLSRLRQIVKRSHPHAGGPRKALPILPALSAHGHHLDLVAFEEQVDRNVMYGKLNLGSSNTLLGVFQMIRGIEILAMWAHIEYRQWFTQDALGI